MQIFDQRKKKKLLGIIIAIIVVWGIGILSYLSIYLNHISTICYCILIFGWMMKIEERIIEDSIRRFLMMGGLSVIFLFLLRICRWDFFEYSDLVSRYLWYAYYIPIIIMPSVSLGAALCVGEKENNLPLKRIIMILITDIIWIILVMTNEIHGDMFHFFKSTSGENKYIHGILYYLIVSWCALLTISTFIILMWRCSISVSRGLWYIPVTVSAFGVFLLVLYYVEGGSPKIGGLKLYMVQEIYSILYIGLWESCIQIGLISSNSGYAEIFSNSSLNMGITDQEKHIVYLSKNAIVPKE